MKKSILAILFILFWFSSYSQNTKSSIGLSFGAYIDDVGIGLSTNLLYNTEVGKSIFQFGLNNVKVSDKSSNLDGSYSYTPSFLGIALGYYYKVLDREKYYLGFGINSTILGYDLYEKSENLSHQIGPSVKFLYSFGDVNSFFVYDLFFTNRYGNTSSVNIGISYNL
jgi:hypothetical protein